MKTRMITITILAAAAITFAQPRMDWNELGTRQGGRFQRDRQQNCCCCEQCPMQHEGFRRQGFDRPSGRSQGMNRRRAAMMSQNAPYAFRGQQQRFAPQQYGQGGMEGRRFAYPDAGQFKRDWQGKDSGEQRQRGNFEGPGRQFRQGRDADKRFDAPKCPKGDNVCPMERKFEGKPQRPAIDAPKPHKAPEGVKAPKDAATPQPEVTELKLRLRNAMIEKDYKAAEMIIKRLAEVDK